LPTPPAQPPRYRTRRGTALQPLPFPTRRSSDLTTTRSGGYATAGSGWRASVGAPWRAHGGPLHWGCHAHRTCGWEVCLRCSTPRSEEHTSELQSRENLVCRLLLEKKNE